MLSQLKPATHLAILYADHRDRRKSPGVPGAAIAIFADRRDRRINRGYYTAAQRYEFYFRVVRTIFYERAHKIHIFKPPCNFLFIIWTINIRDGD